MGTPIQVTKRQLTESDIALLEGYLVTHPSTFSHAYELTPHHTTFSKPVSVQVAAREVFKVPHDANGGRDNISAELIPNVGNFTIDSFSTVYVLPEFAVVGVKEPDNPNYHDGGIRANAGDIVRAKSATFNEYAEIYAPISTNALKFLGSSIASDPGGQGRGTALSITVNLPQLGGNASGPRSGPVVLGYSDSGGMGYDHLMYYININSNYYNELGVRCTPDQIIVVLFNMYTRFGLQAMGWNYNDIALPLASHTSYELESPVAGAPSRRFLFKGIDNVLDAYKDLT